MAPPAKKQKKSLDPASKNDKPRVYNPEWEKEDWARGKLFKN